MTYQLTRAEAIALCDAGYMPPARYAALVAEGAFDFQSVTATSRPPLTDRDGTAAGRLRDLPRARSAATNPVTLQVADGLRPTGATGGAFSFLSSGERTDEALAREVTPRAADHVGDATNMIERPRHRYQAGVGSERSSLTRSCSRGDVDGHIASAALILGSPSLCPMQADGNASLADARPRSAAGIKPGPRDTQSPMTAAPSTQHNDDAAAGHRADGGEPVARSGE